MASDRRPTRFIPLRLFSPPRSSILLVQRGRDSTRRRFDRVSRLFRDPFRIRLDLAFRFCTRTWIFRGSRHDLHHPTVATTGFRHAGTASRFASPAFRQFFSRRVSRYCVVARTAGTEGKRERERRRSDRASKQSKQVGLEQLRTHAHSSLGVLARI